MNRDQPAELPAGFLPRMRALLGESEFEDFLTAFDQPPRIGLRVNTLKISVPDFISIAPFSLAPVGEWEPAGFFVSLEGYPGRHPYHDAGLYYLQEPSAMVAGAMLGAAATELILDLAAAPGGKSTHLASLMAPPSTGRPLSALRRSLNADGLLVANDVHPGRARLLADNLARCGVLNVLVTQETPERLAAAFGPIFHRVLLDAPCSGEGMIRRGAPVEWSESIVIACARRQRSILSVIPGLVRHGGRVLYSTCTFGPEENEEVVAAFLAANEDFTMAELPRHQGFAPGRPRWVSADTSIAVQLDRAVRLWPHHFPGEGHFLAAMRRATEKGPAGQERDPYPQPYRSVPPTAEERRLWNEFAGRSLSLQLPLDRLHGHNGRLFLLPSSPIDPGRARIVRYGLLLGEVRPGRFQPAHELALALTRADVTASVEWSPNDPRLLAYLAGSDQPLDGPNGWVLVTVDGFGIGWGKRSGGRLKNHYPRYLRRPLS